jgi:phosphoribosylanthranilate isomerase
MIHIKFCGITSLEDALAAIEAGADHLGFNFYPPSPRSIGMEKCAGITAILAKEHPQVKRVGVFVNAPVGQIRTIMETCSLDLAQLHGDEPPQALASLEGCAFKAFRGVPDLSISDYAKLTRGAPALLVDAQVAGAFGGTGVTADWPAARALARRYPLLLAGGLTPENVTQAVRQVRPWGVDAASGVEAGPGKKDPGRMKAFVQAAREGMA